MKIIRCFFIIVLGVGFWQVGQAQEAVLRSTFNLRATILVVPLIPLLTFETRTIGNLTIQLESNFSDTHGINFKWYPRQRMQGVYLFTGMAWVKSTQLREDQQFTLLPYAGGGFALRFGHQKIWIWDTRLGIGPTLNADRNLILPIIKSGVGSIF
ncbi:hypothetical protein BKI52_01485 [marine bacterium AO1-C]|nr:hypothetical protein BKI52_01485 [marine bacterium AO1-C]